MDRMNLPNLELLEYQAKLQLLNDDLWVERFDRVKEKDPTVKSPEFECEVFAQTWPDTTLGFDRDDNGEPYMGGQAITRAYTTVIREINTDCYSVFFDGRACYQVWDAPTRFFDDLHKHKLECYSKAKELY